MHMWPHRCQIHAYVEAQWWSSVCMVMLVLLVLGDLPMPKRCDAFNNILVIVAHE